MQLNLLGEPGGHDTALRARDPTFRRYEVGTPADDRLIRGLCVVTRYFLSAVGASVGVDVGL